MNTPSITPAQIVAIIQPVLAFLVAFGVPMSETQQSAVLGLAGTISTALIVADMFIRRARANNAEAIAQAKVAVAQIEPTPGPVSVYSEKGI